MEAALKLARQYFLELTPSQPQRTRFISRKQSYHGITLGALAVGGHEYRRAKFEPLLMKNASRVSPCFGYRGKSPDESDDGYVARLIKELEDEFQRVGPETVCAFIAEPVVGAVSDLSINMQCRTLLTTVGTWVCASGTGVFQSGASCLPEIRRAADPGRGHVRHGTYRNPPRLGARRYRPRYPDHWKSLWWWVPARCWCPCKPPSCQRIGKRLLVCCS